MNKLQISHVCSIILSTFIFPMILVIISVLLNGGVSEGVSMFGAVPFLMFFVGPIFFITGPLVGMFIHYKVRQFSITLVVYLVVGLISGGMFCIGFDNIERIGWYMFSGIIGGTIYLFIQLLTTEKILKKLNLPE